MLLLTAYHECAPKIEVFDLTTKLHIAVDGVVKHVFPYDAATRGPILRSVDNTLQYLMDGITDYSVKYCTCNLCTDEPTCQFAGKDPFNMDGACLAVK